MRGFALPGAAYDVIRLAQVIALDRESISQNLDAITLVEVKSTNRAMLKDDLKGYFFNVTAAELLTAQVLGDRYRFAFVNVVSKKVQLKSLSEVLACARSIYPAFHLRL